MFWQLADDSFSIRLIKYYCRGKKRRRCLGMKVTSTLIIYYTFSEKRIWHSITLVFVKFITGSNHRLYFKHIFAQPNFFLNLMKVLIKKATIVSPSSPFHGTLQDILIDNGIISTIEKDIKINAEKLLRLNHSCFMRMDGLLCQLL